VGGRREKANLVLMKELRGFMGDGNKTKIDMLLKTINLVEEVSRVEQDDDDKCMVMVMMMMMMMMR